MPLDAVLELQVDEESVVQRLAGRGRADDQPEVIRERLGNLSPADGAAVEYYGRKGLLRSIDGRARPTKSFQRVLAALAV